MTRKTQESKNLKTIAETLPNYLDNELVSTNIYILDSLLRGGVELGSTIQIVGESGTGKSTISLMIAKRVCEKGKNVVYLDTENSISMEMIKAMELDEFMKEECCRFYYLRLSTFKEVEKILDEFISTNEISLIICDSLAGLLNAGFTNLTDGISINEATSSYNSRPLGMFMSKYKALVGQKKISFIFTNQYRNKIDIRGRTGTQLKDLPMSHI
jgi:DNA repair protein RadB